MRACLLENGALKARQFEHVGLDKLGGFVKDMLLREGDANGADVDIGGGSHRGDRACRL